MRNWYKPKLSIFLWIAAAAWCGVLFFFSGQSGEESGDLSRRVTEYVLRLLPALPYSVEELEPILRNCAHFAIFALEGALLGAAMMTCLPERLVGGVLATAACAIIAVLNEYHQSFAEDRTCEVLDMAIDSGGALTGVLFAALLLFLIFRLARGGDNVMIS